MHDLLEEFSDIINNKDEITNKYVEMEEFFVNNINKDNIY